MALLGEWDEDATGAVLKQEFRRCSSNPNPNPNPTPTPNLSPSPSPDPSPERNPNATPNLTRCNERRSYMSFGLHEKIRAVTPGVRTK